MNVACVSVVRVFCEGVVCESVVCESVVYLCFALVLLV